MNSKRKNTILSIILFCIYLIIIIIDFFTIKSIQLESVLVCFGTLLLYFLLIRRIDWMYYYGIAIFTGFAVGLGQMLHLYQILPIYDLLLHLISGVLLVFLGHYIFTLLLRLIKADNIPLLICVAFCFLFSLACAAVWEIWEYTGDVLFGLHSQLGLHDTMTDIIAGTIGALIGTPTLYFILKKRTKTEESSQ